MIWDAIVIGGSFAGLSAAMQLARGQRQVLLIDAGEPRNRFAAQSHGFFAADGAEPGELRGRAWQQLRAYPTVQFRQSRVSSAQKLADGSFCIKDETEQQYQSLITLTYFLMQQHPAITPQRIVGHSDIAPGRKTDPGIAFDWMRYRSTIVEWDKKRDKGVIK